MLHIHSIYTCYLLHIFTYVSDWYFLENMLFLLSLIVIYLEIHDKIATMKQVLL